MSESLAEFFLENFGKHRDECAYRQRRGYRMESFTYGEVIDLAWRFAHELDARGISSGERVMIWAGNCAEWVAAFFGCALKGAVVVPMDDGASADFAGRVAQQVGAKLLVGTRRHAEEWAARDRSTPSLSLEDLVTTLSSRPPAASPIANSRDGILQIVFTSGTTADPKGVVITQGNVLVNIEPLQREMENYLKYERWVHPVRFLNLLPLSHVFGQFVGMYLP